MTYQVGWFDPARIAFEMDGPAGIVDYSYGLNPPPAPGDPNYYLDASGVPVCRSGAPYPAHADSRGFYATSAFADAAGRTLLLAWVGAWPASRGWNCCMSLPRVLSLDAAGRLVQQPIPELARLREAPVAVGPLELGGGMGESVDANGDDSGSRSKRNRPPFSSPFSSTELCRDRRQSSRQRLAIEGFTGDTLEVMAEFELDAADAVELALRDDTGDDAVRIRYDGQMLDANGTMLPRVLGDDPRRLKLHLFYDTSVMELFINDGLQTVTRVALPPSSALHLEVAATGGAATLRALTAWPINPPKEFCS
jgi:hypothetical protein